MDKISETLRDHYNKTFAKYGSTSKGVDWGNNINNFETRFQIMAKIFETNSAGKSLLDVGCGYGGFYDYIKRNNLSIKYTGIDLVQSMVDYALQRFPDAKFECGDFLNKNENDKYDYITCNGVLTQKLSASTLEMNDFANRLIKKMFLLSNLGVSFNIMSTYVNYQADNLYYRNPSEMIAWCMSELTPKIKIDSSYSVPFEYTVYLYK